MASSIDLDLASLLNTPWGISIPASFDIAATEGMSTSETRGSLFRSHNRAFSAASFLSEGERDNVGTLVPAKLARAAAADGSMSFRLGLCDRIQDRAISALACLS